MCDDPFFDERLRDETITQQPILWAQAMLEAAEAARTVDARDAILARIGMTLYSRFGVTFDLAGMRRADAVPSRGEPTAPPNGEAT